MTKKLKKGRDWFDRKIEKNEVEILGLKKGKVGFVDINEEHGYQRLSYHELSESQFRGRFRRKEVNGD